MSSNSPALTLTNIRENFRKTLEADNSVTRVLAIAEKKTGVDRERLAYGIIGFLAFYLIIGYGNDLVCNLIGFIYPAYASVKAIESRATDDDTKWLMYWVVYALFGILEVFSDQLLFWIPFYTLSKCLFLLWVMAPTKNGGTHVIYYRVIRPFVLANQDQIDKSIGQATNATTKFVTENLTKSD